MNKLVIGAFAVFVVVVVVLLILGFLGFFSSNKKNNPLIDLTDYGNVKNLSDTLQIFKENYVREFKNPFEAIETNENTQIIIDNIKRITGKEPYLCLKNENSKLENLGVYRPNVYVNIHIAIIKPIMYLLQQNPPQLYDAASIMLPYVKILNQLSFPNFFRNMEIFYESDNVTVKYVRIMKMKLKRNPDNTQTQLDSNEPMSLYQFIAYSFNAEGLEKGKLIYEKSSYAKLIEEIIVDPFIELCKKTYDEIPVNTSPVIIYESYESPEEIEKAKELEKAKEIEKAKELEKAKEIEKAREKARGENDIDLATFTKCVFMLTLRKFNYDYILNNCCDSEDKSTCEQDALKKV